MLTLVSMTYYLRVAARALQNQTTAVVDTKS
jgi:hypothetical protein